MSVFCMSKQAQEVRGRFAFRSSMVVIIGVVVVVVVAQVQSKQVQTSDGVAKLEHESSTNLNLHSRLVYEQHMTVTLTILTYPFTSL